MRLMGPQVTLRPFQAADVPALVDIQRVNRVAFDPFMPDRPAEFFTEDWQAEQIAADQRRWAADQGYAFAILHDEAVVGRVALSNVVRGSWQNATLGYWVDGRWQGRGYCTAAVAGALVAAFGVLGLHRVQAAIMPHNAPSLRVVEKLAFVYEGLAPRYLKIHGAWEDHRIFSLTVEDFQPPAGWTIEQAAVGGGG